jgi:hypothetical protein
MPFARGNRSLGPATNRSPQFSTAGGAILPASRLGVWMPPWTTCPPFVNQFDLTSGIFGYDPANASLLGRQVSLQVVKRWGQ